MELCTARAALRLPHRRHFTASYTHLRWNTSLPLQLQQLSIPRTGPGLLYYTNSSLRAAASEETSSGPVVEDVQPVKKNLYAENVRIEEPGEDSAVDGQTQAFGFLDNLDVKLDPEDTYSILLFGGGALIALWLATAVVGAIDAIPLFPKLMEVVGLGYTLWFSTRYLILKENREELVAKIEEIKQQVLGSNDD